MAVDLATYTPKLRATLKRLGFACIYVAAGEGGNPCRVGYALDLPDAIKRLQRASPVTIEVEDAIWVPDRSIATNIAQSVLGGLGEHRASGGWHNVSATSVAGEMGLMTARLYPNAVTVPHDQLVNEWCSRRR